MTEILKNKDITCKETIMWRQIGCLEEKILKKKLFLEDELFIKTTYLHPVFCARVCVRVCVCVCMCIYEYIYVCIQAQWGGRNRDIWYSAHT